MERKNKNLIKHSGIVQKIEGDTMRVGIVVKSACASCHIKGACSLSDIQEKHVDVKKIQGTYKVGDRVTVSMASSMGFKALFLGYLIPFIIVLAGLITGLEITNKEGLSALMSLALVGVYYLILYFYRDHLRRVFTYQIEPYREEYADFYK